MADEGHIMLHLHPDSQDSLLKEEEEEEEFVVDSRRVVVSSKFLVLLRWSSLVFMPDRATTEMITQGIKFLLIYSIQIKIIS